MSKVLPNYLSSYFITIVGLGTASNTNCPVELLFSTRAPLRCNHLSPNHDSSPNNEHTRLEKSLRLEIRNLQRKIVPQLVHNVTGATCSLRKITLRVIAMSTSIYRMMYRYINSIYSGRIRIVLRRHALLYEKRPNHLMSLCEWRNVGT